MCPFIANCVTEFKTVYRSLIFWQCTDWPIFQTYFHIPYETSTNEPDIGTYRIGDFKLKEEHMVQVVYIKYHVTF